MTPREARHLAAEHARIDAHAVAQYGLEPGDLDASSWQSAAEEVAQIAKVPLQRRDVYVRIYARVAVRICRREFGRAA